MKPRKLGRTIGIGIRVAGRMAAQQGGKHAAAGQNTGQSATVVGQIAALRKSVVEAHRESVTQAARETAMASRRVAHGAGRGLGGLLRPFSQLGGTLLREVTGVFFGMFALFFAQSAWRVRTGYRAGPNHGQFLLCAGLALLFGYLCFSSFRRKRGR